MQHLLFLSIFIVSSHSNTNSFIDWNNLSNPVYSHPDWSTKDACMIYNDGWFYLFFSAFFYDYGKERSHVSCVRTRDFKSFSEPLFIWSGIVDGWTGMCSPNITEHNGRFYLTYNSWGDDHPNGKPNQLFYAVSDNLKDWEKNIPLGRSITVEEDGDPRRAIDVAIAFYNNKVYMLWKAEQTPQVAVADNINSFDWKLLGRPQDVWFENGEFIQIDGKWYLVGRSHVGKRPHKTSHAVMKSSGREDEDWVNWSDFVKFDTPVESFNTNAAANAGFLVDWREYDGYFYLLYAGSTEGISHKGRGNNKLGIARSKNLKTWQVPGK